MKHGGTVLTTDPGKSKIKKNRRGRFRMPAVLSAALLLAAVIFTLLFAGDGMIPAAEGYLAPTDGYRNGSYPEETFYPSYAGENPDEEGYDYPQREIFYVIFVDWNGKILLEAEVPYGEVAPHPYNDPVREGYDYEGWDSDAYRFVTEDLTITAVYREKVYSVTFLSHDGRTLKYGWWPTGSDAVPPAAPSRTGYTFTGWDNNYKNLRGDVRTTATYQPIDYTISYYYGGGSAASNPGRYTVESGSITLNNPTRESYTFIGWSGTNGSTPKMTVTIPAGSYGSRVYIANWRRISEPTPTQKPTSTPTQKPTSTPTQRPTSTPTQKPTSTPTQRPTSTPTQWPTTTPTQRPTSTPTQRPTSTPTQWPVPTDATPPAGVIKPTLDPTTRPDPTGSDSPAATEYPTTRPDPTASGSPEPTESPAKRPNPTSSDSPMTTPPPKTSPTVPKTVPSPSVPPSPAVADAADIFTVTFTDHDGTALKEEEVPRGGNADAPADPERKGYTFIGWNGDFGNVQSDLKITALYMADEAPSITILEQVIPMSGGPFGQYAWGLLNLVMAVVGALLAVIAMKKREPGGRYDYAVFDGDSGQKRRRRGWAAVSVMLGIAGVILFFASENARPMMVLTDGWTAANAVILMAELIAMRLSLKKKKAPAGEYYREKKTPEREYYREKKTSWKKLPRQRRVSSDAYLFKQAVYK